MTDGPAGVLAAWQVRVAHQQLRDDPGQARVAAALDALARRLETTIPPPERPWWQRWRRASPPAAVPGFYLWGPVGRGKSLLMDLFHDHLHRPDRRRTHFHAFMQEVHGRLRALRQEHQSNPVPALAATLAREARVLCLDELQVTDIADAMILGRLFESLFARGVVLVTTSNQPPRELYRDGLQRERFLPFIALIEQHMTVMALAGDRDYRRSRLAATGRWFTPADGAARAALDDAFQRCAAGHQPGPTTLTVHDRRVFIPLAAGPVARLPFAALCETALGAADYLALARTFDTLFLENIPCLRAADARRRFITLIDALYEHNVTLVATAAAAPDGLFAGAPADEAGARAASRLAAMTAEDWPPAG